MRDWRRGRQPGIREIGGLDEPRACSQGLSARGVKGAPSVKAVMVCFLRGRLQLSGRFARSEIGQIPSLLGENDLGIAPALVCGPA
jgi:hypothetical protein